MTARTRGENGAALPAALAALAVAAAVSAALADLARVEVRLARERRVAAMGLAAADACLSEVTAALPVGWDFAAALAGPDAIASTADDGVLSAPVGCVALARGAPGLPTPPRFLLRIDARSGGGHRALDAVVGRARLPGVPALVWVADPATLRPLLGTLTLAGGDARDPSLPPLAGLAAPVPAAGLDDWLARLPGATVFPGTEPPFTAPPPPTSALLDRVRAAGPSGTDQLVDSGPPPVALILAPGDLTIDTPRLGMGLLVVEGLLDVRASLDFTGVLVVLGGISVAPGATLRVGGALWTGPGASLAVDGALVLQQDQEGVTRADALVTLPRRPAVLGLQDQA